VLASDAFIVAPEVSAQFWKPLMVWQLLQVGHLRDVPLILVGRMWPGLVEWARTTMLSFEPPLVNPEDMSIPQCVADADEAIAVVRDTADHRARMGGSAVDIS
jgi:predicted Rossmann-fold nucleotide-binding protein